MKMGKRKWKTPAMFFAMYFAVSAVLLLLCSQCSPLYPLNVWVDANCLMTVGRVMHRGGILYKQIYEQKGPTLYLIHALAACLSDQSFLGVYVLEVLSLTAVLMAAYRIVRRRVSAWTALGMTVGTAACVLIGAAFSRGDSAEEFCLPFLMTTLMLAIEAYEQGGRPMRLRALFVCGLMAGVVATIKFTILGLFVGLCLAEGVFALRTGGLRRALISGGVFLGGMLIPIAGWSVYFALHGALRDFAEVYVYNNIFLYHDATRTAMDTVKDLWHTVRNNPFWVALAGIGMLVFGLDRRESKALRWAVGLMALCAWTSVYLMGRTWAYSPLVLSVFAWLGAMVCGEVVEAFTKRWKHGVAIGAIICCALSLAMAIFLTPNAFLRGVDKDDLAQTRLARYIESDASLLQYAALDDGLYLTTGILPRERFFVRLNVELPEMMQEMDRYVREGIPDYVLTSWEPLPEEFDGYQLIATDAGYDERNRINKLLYLYRRK